MLPASQASRQPQPGFDPTPLATLFGDGEYRFQMRFTRGEAAAFFAPTPEHGSLIEQRKQWLRSAPGTYAALLPEGEPLLAETTRLAGVWHGFDCRTGFSPLETCLVLGEFWEPDFLLLRADDAGTIRLLGGCLCFPSSWKLSDKIGEPIEFIHAPVPGLNASLGPAIHKFLAGLKPGLAWRRVNWGFSRSPELNQHGDRPLPRLDAGVEAEEVWLRVEEQALVALASGILFGIRIVNYSLAEVRRDSAVAANVSHALEAMPEAMARYKGLLAARQRISELLHHRGKAKSQIPNPKQMQMTDEENRKR